MLTHYYVWLFNTSSSHEHKYTNITYIPYINRPGCCYKYDNCYILYRRYAHWLLLCPMRLWSLRTLLCICISFVLWAFNSWHFEQLSLLHKFHYNRRDKNKIKNHFLFPADTNTRPTTNNPLSIIPFITSGRCANESLPALATLITMLYGE